MAAGRSLNVSELAEEFRVSSATIRRDLQFLEHQGIISRTHGGATSTGEFAPTPAPYRTHRAGEKARIAGRVAEAIPFGRPVVGFNGGSTTLQVARTLAGRMGMTVVTNSLTIAAELASQAWLTLIVTGGTNRCTSHQLVGPGMHASMSEIRLDIAVIGVDGIVAGHGAGNHDPEEAAAAAALIARADRVIVAADGSKIGRMAAARVCRLSEIDELFTDDSADPEALEMIRRSGLGVSTGSEADCVHYSHSNNADCAL
nr:DeoR/GlpR family DNA-binding transcription regulator [Phytoactinopolyspora endophytica]